MNELIINKDVYLLYGFEKDGYHIIPPHYQPKKFNGNTVLWLLTIDKSGKSKKIDCGNYTVKTKRKEIVITFESKIAEKELSAVPCCDFFW